MEVREAVALMIKENSSGVPIRMKVPMQRTVAGYSRSSKDISDIKEEERRGICYSVEFK